MFFARVSKGLVGPAGKDKRPASTKALYIGLAVFFGVFILVAIAVPAILHAVRDDKSNKEKNTLRQKKGVKKDKGEAELLVDLAELTRQREELLEKLAEIRTGNNSSEGVSGAGEGKQMETPIEQWDKKKNNVYMPYRPDDKNTWNLDQGMRKSEEKIRVEKESRETVYMQQEAVVSGMNFWKDPSVQDVAILLMSSKSNYLTRRERVMRTWGKHVPFLYTFVGGLPSELETAVEKRQVMWHSNETTVVLGEDVDGYHTLYKKVLASFNWVCKEKTSGRLIDKKWFLKIDDDAFLVTYHLAEELKQYDATQPYFFGVEMKANNFTYASGGAGYILSVGLLDKLCAANAFTEHACESAKPQEFWKGLPGGGAQGYVEDVCMAAVIDQHTGLSVDHWVYGLTSCDQKCLWSGATEFSPVKEWVPHSITFHYVSEQMYQLYAQFY